MSSPQQILHGTVLYPLIVEQLCNRGYCVLHHEDLLTLSQVLKDTLDNIPQRDFSQAGIGRGADNTEISDIRGDEIYWINNRSAGERLWLEWTEGLRLALNKSLFLGLFSYESHFAHYEPGAFYAKHLDAFKGEANRILSTVLYLNSRWGRDDGGELVIYDGHAPEQAVCKVLPLAGTLVVFLSEEFPHEVLPAVKNRYSVAGWFRVNSSSHDRVDPPR